MTFCSVSRRLSVAAVLFATSLGGGTKAQAAPSSEQVQTAIARAKAYLYSIQKNGNWEIVPAPVLSEQAGFSVANMQYGGLTAIAVFSLLASNESPQKPELKAAIEFLKHAPVKGVYALGIRSQIWNMLPMDESVKQVIRNDRESLLQAICTKGNATGFMWYGVNTPHDQADKSTSQFGVLGLWALSQAGAEIPGPVWAEFDKVWRAQQFADGSWCYPVDVHPGEPGSDPTMSMTAAGVATLFITQDYTNLSAKCAGSVTDVNIEKGMEYLGAHFADIQPLRRYYTMFGLSRIGLASGYKYIGKTDWFEWGSDALVHEQGPAGTWSDGRDNTNDVPETAFGLLFLARGHAPILFNKLQYTTLGYNKKPAPSNWNQRPRDVANVTRMIGKQLEAQLNWQIVDLSTQQKDLHDAPMVYIAGGKDLHLSDDDVKKLRLFVEEGGLIIGHADCGVSNSDPFATSFRKLGETMFPGRKFRPLPNDHPIYTAENFPRTAWKTKPSVDGLSNGVRELMLLIPSGDPGKRWQQQEFAAIKSDIFSQLIIDITLYATDQQNLRYRGQTYILKRRDDVIADKKMTIARLKYDGNWDPEPGGWPRLAIAAHNDRKIDLAVTTITPGEGKLAKTFNAAVLVVGGDISLSDAARKEIADYVNGGGTLLVDVAGGAGINKTQADIELAKIFPAAPHDWPILPLTADLYKAGGVIKDATYRHGARMMMGSNFKTPRLRGYSIGGRLAAIYSPEDISSALVGQQVGGVVGYAPESALPLAENILSYLAGR